MHRKPGLSRPHPRPPPPPPPPVIITDRTVPMRYFRCGFISFMFGAVQFLNVLILTLLCVLLVNSVKLTELPPIWERAASSAYHLLFRCLLRYVCSSFPLMFRTSFTF